MTGETELSSEEIEYVKQPLSSEEKAATKGMPPHIARGFVIRKRVDVIVQRRGEARSERIMAAFMQLAEAMQEPQ